MVGAGRLTMAGEAENAHPNGSVRGRILVFGDVIDDIVVVPSGPIRQDTDTPSAIRHRAGGSAANAAAWLGEQGASVDFVGRVGTDDVAKHAALLEKCGVTAHLAPDADHPTGAIVVLVEGNSRSMLTQRGANDWLSADAVTNDLLDAASIVHFAGYSIYHSADRAPLARLFERAAERGVTMSVDPASAGSLQDFGVTTFLNVISGAGLLFPNLDEGRALTGLEDARQVAEALGELFPVVALTLGSDGVLVAERGRELVSVPALSCTVVDPTGAGDAFAAGFLASWVIDGDATRAATAGVAVAAKAVGIYGGRPTQP